MMNEEQRPAAGEMPTGSAAAGGGLGPEGLPKEAQVLAIVHQAVRETLSALLSAAGGPVMERLVQAAEITIGLDADRRRKASEARSRRRAAAQRAQAVFCRKHAAEVGCLERAMAAGADAGRCLETPASLLRQAMPAPEILNRLTERERAMARVFPTLLGRMEYFDILCFWYFEESRRHPGLPVTWEEICERLGVSKCKISAAFRAARACEPERFGVMQRERGRRARVTRGGEVRAL